LQIADCRLQIVHLCALCGLCCKGWLDVAKKRQSEKRLSLFRYAQNA